MIAMEEVVDKTILPFDNNVVWGILQSEDPKDKTFNINIKQSLENLKDKLLIYVSNLDLIIDFKKDELNYDQKVELFDQYLNLIKIYDIDQLVQTLMHVICISRNIEIKCNSIFNDNEANQYIQEHRQLIDRINIFIDSTLVYYAYQLSLIDKINKDSINKFEVIDDLKFVPLNVVNIFKYQQTLVLYERSKDENMRYLKRQFEQPMFGGEYLQKWLYTNNNLCCAFLNDVIIGN